LQQIMEWACTYCTIKNEPENVICKMCFQERFIKQDRPQPSAPAPVYGAWDAETPDLPDYNSVMQENTIALTPDAPPSYEEFVEPKDPNVKATFSTAVPYEDKLDDWSDEDEEEIEPKMVKNDSNSWGLGEEKMKKQDSWGAGDDWSSCEEDNIDDFEPEERTIAEIGWQCVRCAKRNTKYVKKCQMCKEDRNPMLHCDICKCEVPFMCFEAHQKAHEENGQVSPISIAFSVIEKFRNYSTEADSCICWDFAKDFVYKFKEFLETGYDEDPMVIYHWTDQKNFGSIIDGNLKVPDGRKVAVVNGSAHGVGIYAHTDPHWGRNYGKGAKKMFMCLALKGKAMNKHGRERQNEHFDTSERGNIYVFYSQQQVLPVYNIEPDLAKACLPLTKQIIREMSTALRESLGRYEHHDPYANLGWEEKQKLAMLS